MELSIQDVGMEGHDANHDANKDVELGHIAKGGA